MVTNRFKGYTAQSWRREDARRKKLGMRKARRSSFAYVIAFLFPPIGIPMIMIEESMNNSDYKKEEEYINIPLSNLIERNRIGMLKFGQELQFKNNNLVSIDIAKYWFKEESKDKKQNLKLDYLTHLTIEACKHGNKFPKVGKLSLRPDNWQEMIRD